MLLFSSIDENAAIKMILSLALMVLSFLATIVFVILLLATKRKPAKRSRGFLAIGMLLLFFIGYLLWEHYRFR